MKNELIGTKTERLRVLRLQPVDDLYVLLGERLGRLATLKSYGAPITILCGAQELVNECELVCLEKTASN